MNGVPADDMTLFETLKKRFGFGIERKEENDGSVFYRIGPVLADNGDEVWFRTSSCASEAEAASQYIEWLTSVPKDGENPDMAPSAKFPAGMRVSSRPELELTLAVRGEC